MKYTTQFRKQFKISGDNFLVFTLLMTVTILDSCCITGRPGFKKDPSVKEISLTNVLVSWNNSMVKNFDCADEFYVYLWKSNNKTRNDAQIYHRKNTNFSYELDIEVSKNTTYTFQIEAREISHGGCWVAKSGWSAEFFYTTKGSGMIHEKYLTF